jgi:glycosyltransferase involved in cell wall biosynthesis
MDAAKSPYVVGSMDQAIGRRTWRGHDLVILVPTLNRPQKLTELLESVRVQTEAIDRVIIVDGADDAGPVADLFRSSLPIEYLQCHPPGQIRQRNHGLSRLPEGDHLVALLDDDIVLEPEAVEEMIAFWNRSPEETGGVAFNIVNGEPERHTWLKGLLGLSAREPGRVLQNGVTSAVTHARSDVQVQWLPGGATVWRSELLLEHPHTEVSARWAIAEDLLFSYPVGKERPLFVCSGAKVLHKHEADYGYRHSERYHGWTQTIWWYHFVSSNEDLSRSRFIFSVLVRMFGRFGRALLRVDMGSLDFARGQARALCSILLSEARGKSTSVLLEKTYGG